MATSEGRVTVEEGVVYGTAGDGGRELKCDVYTPPGVEAGSAAPCVVLIHGGSWRQGDRSQLRGYGILLGRAGYVCVAPEYRLLGEAPWPAALDDVVAAVSWVRSSASTLGVDPARICVEGNSAGAHLALLAAGTPALGVAAAVAIYAPTLFFVGGSGERESGSLPFVVLDESGDESGASAASPVRQVTSSYPPTFLVHGTSDTTVPVSASMRMYEELVAAGVPTELHLYAEQPHAFDAQPKFGRQVAAEMLLFLDRYVPAAAGESAPAAAASVVAG
jgi:acetyl esterase/lipase